MLSNPICPVCGSMAWKTIGSRTYRSTSDQPSAYVRKRLEVLFQVWCPDTTEVTLSSLLCQHCGFITNAPRPDAGEIDRKYAFLANDATTQHEISQDLASDEKRSLDLYKYLSAYIQPDASVLDFGGGNGRLMRAFMQHGHRCHLIDFPGRTLPGINYLGSHLDDIETGRTFDLIICSHVLEHLADPFGIVHALHSHLNPGGIFYVEVPLEIWKTAPLPPEPVTHVNYFTVDSLSFLLERAGFNVLACKEDLYMTENGAFGLAVRARAQPAGQEIIESHDRHGAANTWRLLHPSLSHQLIRALRYPALARQEALRLLHQRIGKTPLLWRLLQGRPQR